MLFSATVRRPIYCMQATINFVWRIAYFDLSHPQEDYYREKSGRRLRAPPRRSCCRLFSPSPSKLATKDPDPAPTNVPETSSLVHFKQSIVAHFLLFAYTGSCFWFLFFGLFARSPFHGSSSAESSISRLLKRNMTILPKLQGILIIYIIVKHT